MTANGIYPLTERLTIRLLSQEEAGLALQLSQQEGWMQDETDWTRFIRWSDQSAYIALDASQVVGVGIAIAYGSKRGRLANVITHPDYRRRGIAIVMVQALLRNIKKRGIKQVDLDSTPEGLPLYERFGFVSSYDIEVFLGRPAAGPATPQGGNYHPEDFDAIAALDAKALGVKRPKILRDLIEEEPSLVWVDRQEGTVQGFLIAQPHSGFIKAGPWVHREKSGAARLFEKLLPHLGEKQLRVDVLGPNKEAKSLLKTLGLRPARVYKRMHLASGGPIQESPALYYGILHMATG